MDDNRTIEEKIIAWIEAELSNCWSSQVKNYELHECLGGDGNDISFTKRTFESVFKRARQTFIKQTDDTHGKE